MGLRKLRVYQMLTSPQFGRSSFVLLSKAASGIMNSFPYSTANGSFEEAVNALNALQSNAAALQNIVNRKKNSEVKTAKYLEICGLSLKELEDKLSVVHVTGTKGKGSTCSFSESILRRQGFKTGFFSSPHLVSVRERIRLNGNPISTTMFAHYFWHVHNKLVAGLKNEEAMPAYFNFLTVMALSIFYEENVDVIVLEVGIGGTYDSTNVFRKTPVVGFTSIGLDHTSILGNTVDEIAMSKSGIMKPGCIAFTSPHQQSSVLNVLRSQAANIQCTLLEAPLPSEYSTDCGDSALNFLSGPQSLNASLALQLTKAWVKRKYDSNFVPSEPDLKVNYDEIEGLRNCFWPGRFQQLRRGVCNYYLDGAHTSDSISHCASWFLNSASKANNRKSKRILVFNTTGNRDPENLLRSLIPCNFDFILFCPNITFSDGSLQPASFVSSYESYEQMRSRCQVHKEVWLKISINSECTVKTFPSVTETIGFLEENLYDSENHVLVTGSLILVGHVLSILEPNLFQQNQIASGDPSIKSL